MFKVGSRWNLKGNKKGHIFDTFLKNGVIFVGKKRCNKFSRDVQIGQYFAIADGWKILAVGKVTSKPKTIKELISEVNFVVAESDKDSFDPDNECDTVGYGCQAKIIRTSRPIEYKATGMYIHIQNSIVLEALNDELKNIPD